MYTKNTYRTMEPTLFEAILEDFVLNGAKLFNDSLKPVVDKKKRETSFNSPKIDLYEQDNKYHIIMDVPGFTKEDITIELASDNSVLLTGEQNENKEYGRKYLQRERSCVKFTKHVQLPTDANIDTIVATFNNGLLVLQMSKTKVNNRKINIS